MRYEEYDEADGLPGPGGPDYAGASLLGTGGGVAEGELGSGPHFNAPIYPPGEEPGADMPHLILPSGAKIPFAPRLAGTSGLLGTAGMDGDSDRMVMDRADEMDGAISAHHQAAQLQRDWAKAFKLLKEKASPGAHGFTQRLADHYDDDVNQRIGALGLHAHEPFRAAADALRSALIGAAIPFEAEAHGRKIKQDIEDAAAHHAEAVQHAPFLHGLSAQALKNLAGSLPGNPDTQAAYLQQAMVKVIRGLFDGHVERDPDAAEAELNHPRHAAYLTPELLAEYTAKIADRRNPQVLLASNQTTGPIPPLPNAPQGDEPNEASRTGQPRLETDRDNAGGYKGQANKGSDEPGDGASHFTGRNKAELERQLREFGAPEEEIEKIVADPDVAEMIGGAKQLQQQLKNWSLPEQPGNDNPSPPLDQDSADSGNANSGAPGTGDGDKQDQERERAQANGEKKPERSPVTDTLLDGADLINGFDAWAERMREKYGFWADAAILAAQVSIFGLTRIIGGILQGLALDTLFGDWIDKGRDYARDQLGKFYQEQLGVSSEEAQRLVDATLSLIEKMTGIRGGKPAPGAGKGGTPPIDPNKQAMTGEGPGGGRGGKGDDSGAKQNEDTTPKKMPEKWQKQYEALPLPQIEKSIRSFQKRIDEHRRYIENPVSGAERWHKMPEQEKQGVLRFWKKEIDAYQNQLDALKEIIERRKR